VTSKKIKNETEDDFLEQSYLAALYKKEKYE